MSTHSIVCPYCQAQSPQSLQEGRIGYTCDSCGKEFNALAAKVRAKRSRGHKARDSRVYSVRLLHSETEDFVEFLGPYYDFEMRAGDWIVLAYEGEPERVAVVQNLTVNRFLTIPKPPQGCFQSAAAIVVLFTLLPLVSAAATHFGT